MTGAASAVVPDHPEHMEMKEFLIRVAFATDVSSMGPHLLFQAGSVTTVQLLRWAESFLVVSG